MRSFALIALFSFSAQVYAEEPAVTDQLADKLVEQLANKLFGFSTKAIPSSMSTKTMPISHKIPIHPALSAATLRNLESSPYQRDLKVQAISAANSMQAYSPYNAKKYETMSYLPQLSNEDIAKQISYMIRNSWTPALEFSEDGDIYLNTRMGPGYYDNRYWSMYKLPMFGCSDPTQVLTEIENCKREFPSAKIRVIAYDSIKQVQTSGFIVRK